MMDATLFRMTRDHLAELARIELDLNNAGFATQADYHRHTERGEKAIRLLEEMICDLVETLHANKGQVA